MIVDEKHVSDARDTVLNTVRQALEIPSQFCLNPNIPLEKVLLTEQGAAQLGAQIILHHAFTTSAFSKFAFEYGLEKSINVSGKEAKLASQGNPGHDMSVNGERFSLKTEAAKNAKPSRIHISKWMELGKNTNWKNDPGVIPELVDEFLNHMNGYERILILRFLPGEKVNSSFEKYYELIEIPKDLLRSAQNGRHEMKLASKQTPKPGYCHVVDSLGNPAFSLYFDGGGERKLQIKALNIQLCIKHATWEF